MNGVHVVDSGIACALGSSMEEVWPRLRRGESAIGPVRSFETDRLEFHAAAGIPDLEAGTEPNRVCALADRALRQLRPVPADTFVIWAGVKGNVEYLQAHAAGQPPPAIHLPRQYRRWVCQRLGIENRGMELNATCASTTVALAIGVEMIEQEEYSSVLICAADIVSRFTFTGFAALRALSPTTCRPFDADRDGLSLGDAAATMLLAGPATIAEHDYAPQARLTGWGIANDANHITGPARDGCGLIAAIRAALARAGLSTEDIEAWCAHGTGTVYNDAMELTALERVFGQKRFPIFSVKGAIGHTLGAAGALETAVCIRALQERTVPATAGLRLPEERGTGRVSAEHQSFAGNNILTTNSGFSGINAALVVEVPAGDEA